MGIWHRMACLSVVAAGIAGLSGCEVGSVAGDAAGSAITQVQALFKAGKLEVYGLVDWRDTVDSVKRGMEHLRMRQVRTAEHPEQIKLVYRDDREQEVTITVVRRTSNFTELRVDVTLFGPEAMGRAVLRAIAAEMPKGSLEASTNAE